MGHLAKVEGRMGADQSMSNLEDHMLPSLEFLKKRLFFSKTIIPKHTLKKWIEDYNITLLDCPVQSFNLSLIGY